LVSASIDQSGRRNDASILQLADALADAVINQEGNDGVAAIIQAGTVFSDAIIEQLGDSEFADAFIEQGPLGGHSASITQTDIDGTGGFAEISQFGALNTGTITQTDTVGAIADINQSGVNNNATVDQ
jgi:hypothetical protein